MKAYESVSLYNSGVGEENYTIYCVEVESGGEEKNLVRFLEKNGMRFETYSVGDLVHFDILTDLEREEKISSYFGE